MNKTEMIDRSVLSEHDKTWVVTQFHIKITNATKNNNSIICVGLLWYVVFN